MQKINAIILPGNNKTDIKENWYPWLGKELKKLGIEVRAKNMPDPDIARMEIWLPFIENKLKADKNSILVGHSSGAVASMRFAEKHQVLGIILVGVNYTDLNWGKERQSHYYDAPWQWAKIRKNASHIAVFASKDDPFIPIKEPRHIAQKLSAEYFEFKNRKHFGDEKLPEVLDLVKKWTGLKSDII